MIWNEIFTYSQGRLYWLKDQRAGRNGNKVNAIAGSEAGAINERGYFVVTVGGKKYLRHRIVWEMHHGKIPDGMEVDHDNRIPGDDRIENLNLVSRSGNMKNLSMRKDNKSGITGVRFRKDRMKWRAEISTDKVKLSRSFDCFIKACEQRIEWEVAFSFNKEHGRRK